MKRSKNMKKYVESSDSEDEKPLKKKSTENESNSLKSYHESSSESDIGDYLFKPEKLNLDSHFFNTNLSEFEKVEENILSGVYSGVTKLDDSESDTDEEKTHLQVQKENNISDTVQSPDRTSSKMNFKQLQDYTIKIEEAKKHIEIYKAKKQAEENKTDILNLLAAGEGKLGVGQTLKPSDLHSSDFESCASDEEDWQEIKSKTIQEKEKNILPQKTLQITVDMPVNVKKKKGVDLLAAMKRRLNRIRKENQVLVHKVHLLCWLAHGNYVNSAVNDTETLARALSLLPSEQCYPSDRVDLSYLEQIVRWYKRTITNIEKPVPEGVSLDQCLQLQISKKEAYNKNMLVFIFVAILRALGIQTRIVMSLQVEPLRPPGSELHTVSQSNEKRRVIKETAVNKSSTKTNKAEHSKAQHSSKDETKILTNESHSNSKLEKSKISKSKVVKNSAAKREINDINMNSTATCSRRVDDFIDKEVISKNTKARKNITLNKARTNNKGKLLPAKPERRKLTRSKITEGENKDISTTVKCSESTNIKGNQLKSTKTSDKDIMPKIGKSRRSEQSPNFNLPLKGDTKSGKKGASKSKNKPLHKSSLKELGNAEKSSLKECNSEEQAVRKTRSETSKNTLQNHRSVGPDLDIPTKKMRTRSKDSVTSVKTKPRSISRETRNKKLLMTPEESISQVDGINDSNSDIEATILQLDGANETRKKSNNKTKVSKKSSSSASKPPVKAGLSKIENETDSESEFEPSSRSPAKRNSSYSSSETCNLKKLTIKNRLSSTMKRHDVRNDVMNLVKGRMAELKEVTKSRLSRKGRRNLHSDSDSDYAPQPIKKKYHDSDDDFVPKTKVKRRVQVKSVLSDDNDLEKNKKMGNDVWVEVFLEAEEKWISVDVIYGQIHCIKEIYQRATHPVSYIVSWDTNNKVKDVTQRYCLNFNTVTRKQRIDAKWWNDSLKPFMGTVTVRDKEEDDDLARQQLDQPLPKAISEYKHHPLYALKRHLLKFEALYPPDPPTLGFIRGEAVYPKTCVYTLHSRDIWLKQAKVVKMGEQPYKIVKARPKYDRLSNKVIPGENNLEIFGVWQVQDYEPPTAENGIVPKNAFGNVDLFKSCMLPKGCVHLKLPGLNKIARKMNIDIAAAIVGFDFHGGWTHPLYDGFVVCKEYEDQLICAWELEQDELDKKEEEKINKRVYGNWKKLIKGLLIRERLKAKYDFGEPSTSNVKDKKNKAKRPNASAK